VAVHDTGVRGPPIEILWISFFGATLKILYTGALLLQKNNSGVVFRKLLPQLGTPEMVTNSKLCLLRLARLCLHMNGGHFEHFL
jgi:hypothetical protein